MNEAVLRQSGVRLFAAVLAFGLVVNVCAERATPVGEKLSRKQADKQKLQGLIYDLKSNDPKTLHAALCGIGSLGPNAADAIEPLAGMLADGRQLTYPSGNISRRTSFQVNLSAVTALRNIGKPAVEALVTALGNTDAQVRLEAAQALVSIGQPIETKHWTRTLSDSNHYIQIVAARQLGKTKDVAGVEALCKAMGDKNADVRVEVAKALGQIGDARAIDPLIAALSRTDPFNFNATAVAASALAQIGKPALEVLIDRFETFDEFTRDRAAMAFQDSDATREKELLLRCCTSTYGQVREGALYALIKHKMPEGYAEAKRMIDDPVWKVRWTAVRGLAEYARTENTDAIRTTLLKVLREDKQPEVRDRALWSLYFLPGTPPEDFWISIAAILEDESPKVRKSAVETAGKFWDARLTPKLTTLLKDADPLVRAEAAGCLGYHHVESATADLIELLRDKAPRCAERSALALGYLGTDNAVAALIKTMEDRELDLKLRNAAVHGLCVSKNRKAVGPLIDALQDRALKQNSVLTQKTLKELTGQEFRQARQWREWKEQGGQEP